MTVGLDSFQQFGDKATADFNTSFTPAGTARGILVLIVQDASGADHVVGVDYGGTALVEIALSPLLHATGETSVVYGYFLGASVPTGTQTVSVDVDDATAKTAVIVGLTGANDLEVVDTSSQTSDSAANPSITVSGGSRDCFYAGAIHSGNLNPANVVLGTGLTVIEDGVVSTRDFGAASMRLVSRTTVPETGDQVIGFTVGADDVNLLGVAISEVVAGETLPPNTKLIGNFAVPRSFSY